MLLRMLLAATVAGALAAQAPAPTPAQALTSYLGLQDSQIESLRQLHRQHAQTMQAMMAELTAKQRALREQLDRGSTEPMALGKALLEIESLRKRLMQAQEAVRSQALNLLSSGQRAKLDALEQARKLEPAVRQAEALGLLEPTALDPWLGTGLRGGGPGPAPGLLRGRSPADAGLPRGLRGLPPLPQ